MLMTCNPCSRKGSEHATERKSACAQCAIKFDIREESSLSLLEAEVNLNFANRERVHARTMHFLFLVYMRAFRAISDRPAGIITLFVRPLAVTFYSEHSSPDRSFLIREVEDRWRMVTAKSRHDYSVGDAQSGVERREVQLSRFSCTRSYAMGMVQATRESVIMR